MKTGLTSVSFRKLSLWKEYEHNRDEEKGKEGIKHRGATTNGRPSKFALLKPKKSKTIEIFIRM